MKTFNQQVYEIVAAIPAGQVSTYGDIARHIGRPRMARFVGFVSRNSAASGLPWHRVVFKDGSLVPGWEKQQYKSLWAEGVRFSQNKKVIMEKYLWNKLADIPPDMRDWPLVF